MPKFVQEILEIIELNKEFMEFEMEIPDFPEPQYPVRENKP